MYYLKLKHEKTIVEFANDWLGTERIFANGQLVSEKNSVMGATHEFSVLEDGHMARYTVVVRMDMNGQVLVDMFRDRMVIHHNVVAPMGKKPSAPVNKAKKQGMVQLKEYDIDHAIELLLDAKDFDPKDPEIYFHLACAYSISEQAKEGYEALIKAVELKLTNPKIIIEHDKLAYLRLQDAFEGFFESGFTEYDEKLLE